MLAGKCWPCLGWQDFCALGCLCALGHSHAVLLPLSCLLAQKLTSEFVCKVLCNFQVPACHHLNMRKTNRRPKLNFLVKWFVLDVLWNRDYQMSVWFCWRSLLETPFETCPLVSINFSDQSSSVLSSPLPLLLVLENRK